MGIHHQSLRGKLFLPLISALLLSAFPAAHAAGIQNEEPQAAEVTGSPTPSEPQEHQTAATEQQAQAAEPNKESALRAKPPAAAAPQSFIEKAVVPHHNLFQQVLADQRAIWTSPFHMKASDAKWLVPLGAGTAALLLTDHSVEHALPNSPGQVSMSRHVSQLGSAYGSFGIASGFLVTGLLTHNDRARETGMLATRALVDATIVMNALKFAAGRQRPLDGDGDGSFLHMGSGSFPSGHSMTAWTLASVVAHEYSDKKWVPITAYGLASAVSLSRIGGQKHFPSDVLVGSAIGFLIGRYVYQAHQNELSRHRWSRLVPEVGPSFAHGGLGVSLNWNLGSAH